MRKLQLTFLSIAHFGILTAFSQNKNEFEIPEQVIKTVQNLYPEIRKPEWEKENDMYEVEFELNEKEISIKMNENGEVVEKEEEIEIRELPTPIHEFLKSNYQSVKIDEVSKVTLKEGATMYEIEMKDQELLFDSQGSILKNDENDNQED